MYIQCINMTEIETEAKKWGNSIGFRIPKEVVEEEDIEPEDRVLLDVRKLKKPEKDAFGILEDWKIEAQKVKNELREHHGR